MIAAGQWLKVVGTDHRLEAELLLAYRLGCTRTHVIAHPETQLDLKLCEILDADMHAIRAHKPLAYITGQREFWGLDFKVSADVLVPRPETELLVELVLQEAKEGQTILDLGTGSGAIAVTVATERPDLAVSATDISPAALTIANTNAESHNAQVTLQLSDWFSHVSARYNIIVSNPPYIHPQDPHLPALCHEPHIALVAAEEGFAALKCIIAEASGHLLDGGLLILEHGYDQGKVVTRTLAEHNYIDIQSHYDLGGHHRATSARLLKSSNTLD